MKKTVSLSEFRNSFKDYDRDNYTYEGYEALYNWFEEYDECSGSETELDVIAICCDFTEYSTADEAASEYFEYEGMVFDDEGNETETAEEVEKKALNFLNDNTMVIVFDSGIIIQAF